MDRLKAFVEQNFKRMLAILCLWTVTLLSLWASYECYKFGSILGRCECGLPRAQVLALVAFVACAVGLWLAGPIKIPPP